MSVTVTAYTSAAAPAVLQAEQQAAHKVPTISDPSAICLLPTMAGCCTPYAHRGQRTCSREGGLGQRKGFFFGNI
jgi:hypothetical protein